MTRRGGSGWAPLVVALAWIAATVAAGPVRADRIEGAFARYAAAHPDLAVALSVSHGDGAERRFVAGPVRPGAAEAATAEGPWHIGSVAKPFTATLAMRLAERGVLDLDRPIGTYLAPDAGTIHADWRALTLREVLSHSAGLPPNVSVFAWLRGQGDDPSAAARAELARLWTEPLDRPRGAFAYSNLGYVLAAHVIESADGRPWRTLIAEEIAAPLGLDSLGYGAPRGPGAPWGRWSVLGTSLAVDPQSRFADNPIWMDAAGRLHMSLGDLSAWGRAHLDACAGRSEVLLRRESCLEMRRPVAATAGLGWLIGWSGPEGGGVVWHNGSNLMWYAMLMIVPDRDVVIAFAQNRFDLDGADALLAEVLAIVRDGD